MTCGGAAPKSSWFQKIVQAKPIITMGFAWIDNDVLFVFIRIFHNVCYDDAVIFTTPKMKNEIRRSRKGVKITSAGKAAYNDAVINC